jgi:hypothetical protein
MSVIAFEKMACTAGSTGMPMSFAAWAASTASDSPPLSVQHDRPVRRAAYRQPHWENLMQLDAALPIVRALADGVNPITGEAYPEQSPYAEPRTLRALYSAVDLMQKEIDRERRRERLPANFGKPWTTEEDQAAVTEYDSGIPMVEMARRHLRTQSSIRLRLEKLGKIEPAPVQ